MGHPGTEPRRPVQKLNGGPTRRNAPVYCHCPSGSRLKEFALNVAACQRRGYHAMKTTLPVFYGAKGKERLITRGLPAT